MGLLIGAYVIFVVPWLLAGWFRIPRYVRCLHETDYHANAYLKWITTHKVENRYIHIFITLVVILMVVSCCGSIYLPRVIYNSPISVLMVNVGFLLLSIIFAPRSLPQQKAYMLSSRGIRLLIIGFFVELLPTLASIGVISLIYELITDPKNSAESMVLAFGFVTLILLVVMIIGPFTFIFTPYAVLLALRINQVVTLVIPKNRNV